MKNNIVFKFIAIILCAASLLGTIGGITGVVVLTGSDLYNRTVEQVQEERTEAYALDYATVLARMYASTELGGSPEQMVRGDGFSMFEHEFSNYGYRILDAEGELLSSYNTELTGSIQSYTFYPTGQYMHLVSLESESERMAREADERIAAYSHDVGDGSNEVPAEGISIDHVMFLDADGRLLYEANTSGSQCESTYYLSDGSAIGYSTFYAHTGVLFYNQNGELVYSSYDAEHVDGFQQDVEVAEYFFLNYDKNFLLSANDTQGLGTISTKTGNLRFISYFTQGAEAAAMEPLVEEPVPETTEGWVVETIPGADGMVTLIAPDGTSMQVVLPGQEEAAQTTEPMTEPDLMATEETTLPVETTGETLPSSASAVPLETIPVTAPTTVTEAAEYTEATEATEAAEAVTEPTLAETTPPETVPEETVPEETEPVLINGKTLDNYQVNQTEYYDRDAGEQMVAKYVYLPMPELTVELYVDTGSMRDASSYELLALVRQFRNYLLPAIGICLLAFAIFTVYLCTAAGRKPKTDEVRAGGLNRLPLDLYLGCAAFAVACCINYGVEALIYLIDQNLLVGCATGVGLLFLASLIFVAFCFAFVAQIKAPGGFWWRNTLCGYCIRLFIRFGRWLETFLATKGFPWLGRTIKKLWQFTCKAVVWLYHVFENGILWLGDKIGRIFRWIGKKLQRFLSLMPMTWQWTVVGLFWFCMTLIAGSTRNDVLTLLCMVGSFALVLYGAHCFGVLMESTKKMGKGNLDTKVEDKLMIGSFKEFAGDLNDLADVAVVAAQKQLKSERMKTELITNVSHDIKTPLTSIINYVDLLQKPHTDEEEAQYLEVLERQSQRLKKLIDDLMDMSKANTGNMQVDITRVDAVESVNQALGEFADKLNKAQLIPVFRHDDASVPMMADGKLVWRVLSNLLSNAVKYAMPGTRLYIDLMTLEGKVVLSLKNISREELNIDADELMERFVRGDDSRNTEGSGLGLNIAKSLMELQKGQLQLLVDGDLFKITLIFPGV